MTILSILTISTILTRSSQAFHEVEFGATLGLFLFGDVVDMVVDIVDIVDIVDVVDIVDIVDVVDVDDVNTHGDPPRSKSVWNVGMIALRFRVKNHFTIAIA